MLTQHSVFGTIAGLEVTALAIFVSLGKPHLNLAEKILFTIISGVLFLEVAMILWMINQERRVAWGDSMQCFQENETFLRTFLIIIMVINWALILSLLVVHVW
ncbi:hypothetical protein KKE78_02795 [Patescibacteria group bacterium]|nr:hypothetical protein [Patescibacteria group bacterium]